MKDKILDIHPIIGIITYKDLINDLIILLNDYKDFEDIIINILQHQNYDDETISTLFKNDIKNRLEWIVYVLKQLL